MVGLLLSSITLKTASCNLWKNILLGFSVLLIFSLVVGIFLVDINHIAKIFEYFKIKTTSPLELGSLIPTIAAAAFTIGIATAIYYWGRKYCDTLSLSVLTGLLVAVLSIQFSVFALPVMKQFEIKRPLGYKINKFLPSKEPVYLFNFGISNYQPFIYYIRPPVKYIFEYDEITENVNYVLFDANLYGEKLLEPGIFKKKPVVLTEIKFKRNKFILVHFIQPGPALK
jgi:hypothetical protein